MLEAFGSSDVGCVRELNEDCFCIKLFDENKDRGFFILADGMGGHNAGEVASQTVIKFIADNLRDLPEIKSTEEISSRLREAIEGANEHVYRMSVENSEQRGMGTTVVAVVLWDGVAYVANVGDSRAYAVHKKDISQITTDHSIVEELVIRGTITKEEAKHHPQKNIITRAVGTDSYVKVDLFEHKCVKDSSMILCSDGLCSMVDDEDICEIVRQEKKSENIVCKLIDAAKNSGGLDNITVICIRFI